MKRRPRFFSCAVGTGIQWPKVDTTYKFGTWEIIAFAPTEQHDASLHINLAAHQLTLAAGLSVLNQLLSIATWLDDIYAVLRHGLDGATAPNPQARQTREFPTSILEVWANNWQPVADERSRLALAIYREAVNMQHYYSLSFAALGFYRVLELACPNGKQRRDWMTNHLKDVLTGDGIWWWNLQMGGYAGQKTPEALADFLYKKECRAAAAHATGKGAIINPDDGLHYYKMGAAAVMLRKLAHRVMQIDIGLSRSRWDQKETRRWRPQGE